MANEGGTVIKAKTPEGTKTYKLEDIRPFWLYDVITILTTNTAVEFFFFQTPQGKTLVDTNLRQFSTIQVGWTFDITRMRLVPQASMSSANGELIFDQAVMTYLKEGDIEIFSLPAMMLNAGCGFAGATTVTNTDMVSLGLPSLSSVLKLPFALTLVGGKTFLFRLRTNAVITPSVNTRITMVLEGILRRDVVGA
jgi:hypothetical protein